MKKLILADTLTAKAKEMIVEMALAGTTINGVNAANLVFDEVVTLIRENLAECEDTCEAMALIKYYDGCINKYSIIDTLAEVIDPEAYENYFFAHGDQFIECEIVNSNKNIIELINYRLEKEIERFECDVFPSEYNYFREYSYRRCMNNIEIINSVTNNFDDIIEAALRF